MPISVAQVQVSDISGFVWKINDEVKLARLVAQVYLGHAHHVEKILVNLRPKGKGPSVDHNATKSAKALLKINTTHRDGLLFQTISWIVAQSTSASKNSVIKLPHLIPAHKGFDGLQINIGGAQKLEGVVIFEDKATKNARSTITNKVWPEFRGYESGARENELMQETTALLYRLPGLDVDKTIEGIVWKHVRKYRVSVTGEPLHGSSPEFESLFSGYDEVAPGNHSCPKQLLAAALLDRGRSPAAWLWRPETLPQGP